MSIASVENTYRDDDTVSSAKGSMSNIRVGLEAILAVQATPQEYASVPCQCTQHRVSQVQASHLA